MTSKAYSPLKYKVSMLKDIVSRFEKGETREEFCAAHNIAEDTFSEWVKKIPEFAEAYARATTKAKAHYMKMAYDHMIEDKDGAKLNIALYNRVMNTRFNLPSQRKLKIKGLASKQKIQDKMSALLKSIEDGDLTSLEAVQMSRVVESAVKINEHSELEERIAQIEQAQKIDSRDEDFIEVNDEDEAV